MNWNPPRANPPLRLVDGLPGALDGAVGRRVIAARDVQAGLLAGRLAGGPDERPAQPSQHS